MARVEERIAALGLTLPPALQPPPGMRFPFQLVRVVGDRALISGHGPQAPDGSLALATREGGAGPHRRRGLRRRPPHRARDPRQPPTGHRRPGPGRRRGCAIFGMVNSAPGFNQQPTVINGFSDLILELYGPEVGAHARSAVGMAELPVDIPVEIEGEVRIRV